MTTAERKEYNKQWRKKNKNRVKELHTKWYEKNKSNTDYKNLNYARGIKKRYGITLADVNKLLSGQSNRCAICGKEFINRKTTHIDHCHNTGKVRGVLCEGCNIGLGGFKDKVDVLRKAIQYLSSTTQNSDTF